MKKICRRMAITMLLSVAGCMTLDPIQYVDLKSANFGANQTGNGVLNVVDKRLSDYAGAVGRPERWQIADNTILTIAAVGGIAVAVFAHGAARANWLAGVGLGAGAATAAWSWANPGPSSDAYRLGAYRAGCLRDAAIAFEDPVGNDIDKQLSTNIKQAQEDTTNLQGALTDDNFTNALVSADGPTASKATKANEDANRALQDAPQKIVDAEAERTRYQRRSTLVYVALQKIDAQVYAGAKVKATTYPDAQNLVNHTMASAGTTTNASPLLSIQQSLNLRPAILPKRPGTRQAEMTVASQVQAIQKVQTYTAKLNNDTAALNSTKVFSQTEKTLGDCTTAAPPN
ncbi:hypothetical protein [Burkholderia stagnalis]